MVNKKVIIGLGIFAVAGIGYYMWKNKKSSTSKSLDSKLATSDSEMGASMDEEEDSNVTGAGGTKPPTNRCPKGWYFANNKCNPNSTLGYVAGWENGQQPYSGYTAGWQNGAPAPCNIGYNATLDPVKGTICTRPKSILKPFYRSEAM